MDPHGAVQTIPLITPHQTARQRIFFDDGNTKMRRERMIPIESPPIPEPMISASKGLSVSIGKKERLFHAVFTDKFSKGADRRKGADPPTSLVSILTP